MSLSTRRWIAGSWLSLEVEHRRIKVTAKRSDWGQDSRATVPPPPCHHHRATTTMPPPGPQQERRWRQRFLGSATSLTCVSAIPYFTRRPTDTHGIRCTVRYNSKCLRMTKSGPLAIKSCLQRLIQMLASFSSDCTFFFFLYYTTF